MELKSKYLAEKKKLILNTDSAINFIDIDNLILCKHQGEHVDFYLEGQPAFNLLFPFEELNSLLGQGAFIQTDDKHLINLRFMEKVPDVNENFVEMAGNIVVPVSTERKNAIIDALEKYHSS